MPSHIPWIVLIWAVLCLSVIGYTICARKRRGAPPVFPKISPGHILYQENFASGRSLEDWLTRMGGARNCLKLVVTQEELWVKPWFFFALLGAPYDLIHRIPKQKILSVQEKKSFFLGRRLLIEFTRPNGAPVTLELAPKNYEDFLRVLWLNLDMA